MTAISLLGGDFELLLDDENNQNGGSNAVAGMRAVVRPNSPPTTNVYTTRTLYSAIADVTDDVIAMGFRNPMLPVTPNAYTMENKYFIQRRACEFLSEGAIDVDHTVASADGVYRVPYQLAGAAVAPADNDIGRRIVSGDGDNGTLIDFETEPDGTTVVWIRPETGTDTFDADTVDSLECTTDGGAFTVDGGANGTYTAATNGISKYAAIQAIGSVPTATEVYLYQDRFKITDYTGGFQWWTTDPTVSLGIISILVRTQNSGTLIADGDVEVFARRYTSSYDNFRLNVAAGGFSALPLASAPDINNTTGYARFTTDAETGGGWGSGDVGTVFRQDGAGNELNKGVITAISGTGPNYTVDFYHTGDLTGFIDNDVVEDLSETKTMTLSSNETATPDGPTEAGAGNGATVTIALGHTDVDHSGDGTTEPYSITIDAQGDVPIATVYEVIKYRTRRGATSTDLFGSGTNVPGESYRGIDGFFEYDANTGTMTDGDDVDVGSDWTARLIAQSTGTTPTYITVTDQQTSLDSVVDDNVIDDESGDDVTVHAGGTQGIRSISSPKASPFGTFTGSQIFGAPGVAFINPAGTDTQAYILTDDFGVLNNPPNTITFTVANTVAGDWITAAQMSATTGVMEKTVAAPWGLIAPAASYNRLGDTEVRIDGAIAASEDVPASGTLRIVDIGQKEEHLYFYSSRTLGTPGIFTLTNEADFSGTSTAGTSDTKLFNSGATWTTGTVPVPGMMVRNTTNGGDVYEITVVDSATELTLKKLYGSGDAFASGDAYEINFLIGGDHTATPADYGADDGIYITYIDELATGTSVNNQFIKSTSNDFTMVVNVRQGKIILPFTINQLQQDDSVTVTTVRTPDTIAV